MSEIINPSFDNWVQHLFDHPVTSPEWYFALDADFYDCAKNPVQSVDYIKRLFASPAEHLQKYTDAQLNQGLWMLISSGQSHIYTLFNEQVPLEARIQATQNMYNVFEQVFAVRCSEHLGYLMRSHDDQVDVNPLNSICYMWWDIIPFYGKSGKPNREIFDSHCLDVMEHTLTLDSRACRESALHGLGHWKYNYPERVQGIIDTFLKQTPNLDNYLHQYALYAYQGSVL